MLCSLEVLEGPNLQHSNLFRTEKREKMKHMVFMYLLHERVNENFVIKLRAQSLCAYTYSNTIKPKFSTTHILFTVNNPGPNLTPKLC